MGNDNIGNRIKEKRLLANMSQETLAARIGTIKQTIYKYEKGIVTNIPIDTVIKIANALDTTPEYLMGWKEEAPLSPELQAIVGDRPLSPAMRELLESIQTLSDDQCEQITDFMNYLIEKRSK